MCIDYEKKLQVKACFFFHTEVNFEILGYFISIRCLFPDQS